MRVITVVVVALALSGVACKKKREPAPSAEPAAKPAARTTTPRPTPTPAAKPASVTEAERVEIEAATVAVEGLGQALASAGADCGKGAAALANDAKALEAALARAKALRSQGMVDPALRAWLQATYGRRTMVAFTQLERARKQCESDAAFVKAYDALDLPLAKRQPAPPAKP